MDYLALFDIPYVGLKNGTHSFHYDIDEKFFDSFENSPVKNGKFSVDLSLERSATMMLLNFSINGSIEGKCDRCLSDLTVLLSDHQEFIIKFGEETIEAEDNMMTLASTEYKISVAQNIYEYISLLMPSRIICNEVDEQLECDSTVIEKLQSINNREDQLCSDPRWEELKKLKTK